MFVIVFIVSLLISIRISIRISTISTHDNRFTVILKPNYLYLVISISITTFPNLNVPNMYTNL